MLLLAGLLLSACNTDERESFLGRFSAAGALQQAELEPCSIASDEISYQAECGHLLVPENWQDANSRLIYLPLMRFKGNGKPGTAPLIYLAGGPGQSNMKALPSEQLLAQNDFILLGYRGVDGSVHLQCSEFSDALSRAKSWFDDEAQQATRQAFEQCFERHQANGIDINGYQIPAMIEDFELMRRELGYEKLNLLSRSFGTRVALLYAHRYPDSIHRSVMEAANPPGRMVWEAGQTDNKLSRLNAYCQQQSDCREKTTDLLATIRSVLANTPESWLGFSIDPNRVKAAAFGLLYSKKTMPYLVDIFVAAEKGDASGLALLSKSMDFIGMSGMVWGDLYLKAAGADADISRDYKTELNPEGTVLGAPMSELLWPAISGMRPKMIPLSYREAQTSPVETLIISGDLDVSTPAENAMMEMMPHLPNGRQVILRQAGHMDLYSPEVTQMYLKFLATGEVDTSRLVERPIQFETRYSVNTMIKGAILAALLLLTTLLGLIWLGYRKFRQK